MWRRRPLLPLLLRTDLGELALEFLIARILLAKGRAEVVEQLPLFGQLPLERFDWGLAIRRGLRRTSAWRPWFGGLLSLLSV